MGPEMMRMSDRHGREFCMSPTHEEVITDLFRREIRSYKQLPCNFFQIQTKFRDEIRPRFGVMRSREFIMKDGYSFDIDQTSFDETYQEMYDCYTRIFTRMQLNFRAVEADTGNIGGSNSHEFQVLATSGEDTIAYASEGDYAANLEKAIALRPDPRPDPTETLEKIATPGQTTIEAVAAYLEVPQHRCLKTLIVEGEDSLIALVLRGDHELNEVKAEKLPGVTIPLSFANEADIEAATGSKPGSIGPVGLALSLYADESAFAVADWVSGANEEGFHYRGGNWGRDVPEVAVTAADFRNVVEGDKAPDGQGELKFLKGIEVGHIFQLGDIYSVPMQATVLDKNGKSIAPIMGCYGIGVTRLVAAIIEQNHDEIGIIWPEPVAPFFVHIVALNYGKSEAVRETADALYQTCIDENMEVLLDDRDERPGVKFADADLIGIPHRITVGDRGLKEGNVEYRSRTDNETIAVAKAEVLDCIRG